MSIHSVHCRPLTSALLFLGCLAATFFCNTVQAENAGLRFEHVWIAEAPPVSKVLAAYMVIENPSEQAIEIQSAESDLFSSTAFHRTVIEDGVARMQHQPSLTVPAHGSLELKPGSFHMMLFNPATPLRAGDRVDLVFSTGSGEKIPVIATVKKAVFNDHQHH